MRKLERHYDLTPREIAGIFIGKGWQYGGTPYPVERDITKVIDSIVDSLERARGEASYGELGRFVVWRDAEFPDSYEIAIKVGHVSPSLENPDVAP